MFSIHFLDARSNDDSADSTRAEIRIGDFVERLEVSVEYWNVERYCHHWIEAVTRVVRGSSNSCLITSITDPSSANFLFWWPVYRFGDRAVFQNQVLFLDDLDQSFDASNPFAYIRERTTHSDEGVPISEWEISMRELESWLRSEEQKPSDL